MARTFPVWTQEETEKLRQNYQTFSIEQIAQTIGKSPVAVIRKLQRLSKKYPEQWQKQRVKDFWTDWYSAYTESRNGENRKKINLRESRIRCQERRVYLRFARNQYKWGERDLAILANTYLTRDFLDLLKIFAAKSPNLETKLKSLLRQDPQSWDDERIEKLQKQAASLTKERKAKLRGYYSSQAYFQGRKLRKDIDGIIVEGKTKSQVAQILNVPEKELIDYMKDRNLNNWYRFLQPKRNQ